jgi:positive regulator of sigma E activity
MTILESATKIVLLIVVITLCGLMIFGAVTKQIDYKDIVIAFVGLLGAIQGFYFAYKGDNSKDFAGK